MQPYKNQPKVNSKACDQCYRCKVKCTMELNGCARCRATNGVCTYSLGKWMGRPKKSGHQASRVKARESRGARSASLDLKKDYSDRITNMPNDDSYWELAPFAIDDAMEFSEHAAISTFSIDDYQQTKTEGYYSSTNGSLGRASSMKEMGSRATSHYSDSSRATPKIDAERNDGVLSRECQRNDYTQHLYGSDLCPQTPQTPSCHHGFNLDSMGMDSIASPQVSLTTTISAQLVEQAERADSGQMSPRTKEESVSPGGESCHCKCSEVALACLNKISALSSGAAYVDRLEVIQLIFLNTESLVFCNDCPPNMIIAKCCIILGNAYELVRESHALSEDRASSAAATSRQLRESVRKIKRRATMLFAGLNMLQDSESGNLGLSKVHSEFLAMIAQSWVSLREE